MSRLQAAWPDPGTRKLATANLITAAVLVFVAAATLSGRLGAPLPGALVRVDSPVNPAHVLESVVRSLLDARAATAAAAAQKPAPPPPPKVLPHGKGMWMWQPSRTEGGNVEAIVARAKGAGLSHIYVRTGSSTDGFYAGGFLNQLLPVAHNAGLIVYGWDFPEFHDWRDDVNRAVVTIRYRTPDGHGIDGFSPDIETESEGTHITPEVATAYGQGLRGAVGPHYTLIATVPRPSPARASFPFKQVIHDFDGVAPMIYWLNREPGSDVLGAVRDLAPLGKPIFPVGQAYDGGPEGGRPGVPPPAELARFMQVAADNGVSGVSFWSWQAADQAAWDTIKDTQLFRP